MVSVFNTTSHLFKIENFSLFKKHGIERVDSSFFDLAGHKWLLSVFPYGDRYAQKGHASIYLYNYSTAERHVRCYLLGQCELFLVNQLGQKGHSYGKLPSRPNKTPSEYEISGGYNNFISFADLERNGYLIGDCCIFGVKFHGTEPAKPGTGERISLIEKPLNHKVTWMMTKFSSFDRNVHKSHDFVVGNRRWRIKVYPRGCKGGKDKSFSVYLSAEGFINNAPKAFTYAKFNLRVLDQVSGNHVEKTVSASLRPEPDDNHGFEDFMPLGNLREPYLVKDKLYVGVDFEVISITSYY